jgi:hypothetical protein
VLLGFVVFGVHLVATIAGFGRTTYPNPPSDVWGGILAVLTFPLLWIRPTRILGFDTLDWMVIGNSLIWAACITIVVSYAAKRRSTHRATTHSSS